MKKEDKWAESLGEWGPRLTIDVEYVAIEDHACGDGRKND